MFLVQFNLGWFGLDGCRKYKFEVSTSGVEDGYMEEYFKNYKRRPTFVYGYRVDGEFEAQQIRSWDPSSFPDWYRAKWPALQRAVEKLG